MADEERKIFIDEDWKAQVEREKQKAREESQQKAKEPEEEAAPEGAPGEGSPFQGLIASLAAQTMFSLGMIAAPDSNEVMVDLGAAKTLIDMLMALRQKTKGNLTPEEEGHLTEVLSELQRVYAIRAKQMTEASLKQSGIDPKKGQPE